MATRLQLRRAVQRLTELRQKHPHRKFWIKEYADCGWGTDYWIMTKPFRTPRWFHKFLPRQSVALERID